MMKLFSLIALAVHLQVSEPCTLTNCLSISFAVACYSKNADHEKFWNWCGNTRCTWHKSPEINALIWQISWLEREHARLGIDAGPAINSLVHQCRCRGFIGDWSARGFRTPSINLAVTTGMHAQHSHGIKCDYCSMVPTFEQGLPLLLIILLTLHVYISSKSSWPYLPELIGHLHSLVTYTLATATALINLSSLMH